MGKNTIIKSLKYLAYTLLAILLALVLITVYFNSKPGQKRLSKLLFGTVSEQIGTPVSGQLSFSIPDWVNLNDLLILDQNSDTLLYAKKAHLDVALFKLIQSHLVIEKVELKQTVAKISKRDGKFNFDYILDSFGSDTTSAPADTTPSTFRITLTNLLSNDLRVSYNDHDLEQLFDVKLATFNSGLDKLDLNKGIYELKNTSLSGLYVKGFLGKPSGDTTSSGPLPDIRLKNIIAKNLNWDLDLGEQTTTGSGANLDLYSKSTNLPQMEAEVDKLLASFRYITFKDKKAAIGRAGEINFSDLALQNVKLGLEDIQYSEKAAYAKLKDLSFEENSGLQLITGTTDASYIDKKIVLKDLILRTAGSGIKSGVEVDLDLDNMAKSRFNVQLEEIKLAANEALFFSKDLVKNPSFANIQNDVFTGKGRVYGTAEDLNLENLYLSAPKNTRLRLNGKIQNKNVLALDLTISDFYTDKHDLKKFAGSIPENMDLPEKLNLNGNVKGTLEDLHAQVFLNSSQGGARLAIHLKDLSKVPSYKGTLDIENYAAGALIQNQDLGTLAGSVNFDGRGFDSPSVNFDGRIEDVSFQKMTFSNLAFNGDFQNQTVNAFASINDPKAQLTLNAMVDMATESMLVTGNTQIQKIDLKALGVTDENIFVKGNFDIKQLRADLKNPFIDFAGTDISITKDGELIPIGEMAVLTESSELERRLELTAPFIKMALSGNFQYDKLQDIFMSEINKYFHLPSYVASKDSLDYYFDINGKIDYHPVFTAFVPSLKSFESVTLSANLNNSSQIPFSGKMSLPRLQYDSIQVINTTFDFSGDGSRLNYELLAGEISNPSFRVRKSSFSGALKDNVASFSLAVKDSLDKNIHSLAGFLDSQNESIRVSFDESGTMIFYEEWAGNPYGYIDYSSKGLSVSDVVFSKQDQLLKVTSVDPSPNAPLDIFTTNIDLNFFSKAILQDSTLIAGKLDLDVRLMNYMGEKPMAFEGDFSIADLVFSEVALGNLKGKAESQNSEQINVFASLVGDKNDFELTGAFYPNKQESLDFKLNLASLEVKALDPFLKDIIYDLDGRMTGEMLLTGSPDKPVINGFGYFNNMAFRLVETGALMKVDEQRLALNNSKVELKDFSIKDSRDKILELNGHADFSSLPDFTYNLAIDTDGFEFINSKRGQSEYFYGQGYFKTNLNISGKNMDFRLVGDIESLENTNLTVLMPDDAGGADLNSVVTFVQFDGERIVLPIKRETEISLANALNINIKVDEKTTLNVLMNPITGDQLTAVGNAQLNVAFDNMGDPQIVGRYNITEGNYEMTYQTIRRKFEITPQSKSYISFSGDPMLGDLAITAQYNVPGRKNLRDYLKNVNQKSTTQQSGQEESSSDVSTKTSPLMAEVRVDLVLTGKVTEPKPIFELVVPKKSVSDEADITALTKEGFRFINDDGIKETVSTQNTVQNDRMLESSIMLLVTGTFGVDQIISSSGTAYGDLARSNISQLISSQLDKYASNLIRGVDINVGLESSGSFNAEDATRSTNLNVGVSKSIANDRLIVMAGKNFELENKNLKSDEIFDNLEARWLITRDGRYSGKVFRKNQNLTAIEGQVVETGLGLVIAIDYNTWKELMKKRK